MAPVEDGFGKNYTASTPTKTACVPIGECLLLQGENSLAASPPEQNAQCACRHLLCGADSEGQPSARAGSICIRGQKTACSMMPSIQNLDRTPSKGTQEGRWMPCQQQQ
eukprot:1139285-Pelagomonas_calceolata.AAC.5